MSRADIAIHLGEASVKVESIINSCETREQLEVARRIANNWVIQCNYYRVPLDASNPIKKALELALGEKALDIYKQL